MSIPEVTIWDISRIGKTSL